MILLTSGTKNHRGRLLGIQPKAQHGDVIELRRIAPELGDRLEHSANQLLGGRVHMLVQRVKQALFSKHVLGGVIGLRHATIHEKKIDIDPNASPEEIQALANEEGIELTAEQLEQISGGWDPDAKTKPSYITQWIVCDTCNGAEIEITEEDKDRGYVDCPTCHTRYVL